MNSEGYGSNGAPFEYAVEKQGKEKTKRKRLLIFLYAVWGILFFSIGILVKLILPLLCFIPLSLWVLIWLTWRFTHEEICITLFAGAMTVTRKFDGKNEKKLAETRIKNIEFFEKYSQNNFENIKDKNIIYATATENFEQAYIAVWGDTAVIMETNEKAMNIIKYYR